MKRFFISLYLFIILSITIIIFGLNFVMGRFLEEKYQEESFLANQEISRGCFYLLEQELEHLDTSAKLKKVAELQTYFGYPLELKNQQDLKLTDEENLFFTDGKIVVRNDGDLLFKRIGNSDTAMLMGPFMEVNPTPFDLTIYFTSAAIFLGVASLFWVLFFWKRLSRISSATKAFGKGDLSARVKLPAHSSLSHLAHVFNSMADHIEQLISSHKELVNSVSHELRTPISRIRFGLENFKDPSDDKQSEQLLGIQHDIDELDDLVNELLRYAKFEGQNTQATFQQVPMVSWLKEYLKTEAINFPLPVHFSHKELDAEITVDCDPRLLERAIHNLIQNGSRFAKSKIELHLSLKKNLVILTVEDDGPGIPDDDRQRIFNPFIRLDGSRNRQFGGHGLGLSIVKQILRCHHGDVSVRESNLGGAAFVLQWPQKCKQ